MNMLLTKEEAALYKEFGPASWKMECLQPQNVCQDENYADPWRWYRLDPSFSDNDARRVAEGLATVREMYPNRVSDKLLEAVFEHAEESRLSALGILAAWEDLVRTQKSAPSYAQFIEPIDELIRPTRQLTNTLLQAQQRFGKCARDFRKGYNTGVVENIRQQIPDFPDLDEMDKAWQTVLGVPFGTFVELSETERGVPSMIEGLRDAAPWPMVPLYCISLVAKIPPEDWGRASDYYEIVVKAHGEYSDLYNSPMIWKRVIAEYQSHEFEDDPDWQWLDDFLLKELTQPNKDEIADMWAREKSMLDDTSN